MLLSVSRGWFFTPFSVRGGSVCDIARAVMGSAGGHSMLCPYRPGGPTAPLRSTTSIRLFRGMEGQPPLISTRQNQAAEAVFAARLASELGRPGVEVLKACAGVEKDDLVVWF